jgi:hypothetical protein
MTVVLAGLNLLEMTAGRSLRDMRQPVIGVLLDVAGTAS